MGESLVVRDGGGLFHSVLAEIFYRPFEAATGVHIVGRPSSSEPMALITEQAKSGNPDWDMSLLSRQSQVTLAARDCLEPIGPLGPSQSQIPVTMRDSYMCGLLVYASVLAYRVDGENSVYPRSWRDFWNVDEFPGRRALRRHPFDTFEQAQLADGVEPSVLYPFELDRSIESLNRIRDHVSVWWGSGDQSTDLLRNGDVEFASVWSGRASAAARDGAPVAWTWDQGIWTYEGFAIVKGTKRLALCREFVEFCADATRQAACAEKLSYGPVNPKAFEHVPLEVAEALPTHPSHLSRMVQMDSTFWASRIDDAVALFERWLAKYEVAS